MTPSAARLLGLVKHRSKGKAFWISICLADIAELMQLSPRTLARAKAELEGYGLVKWRTISNGTGKGHKLYAALPGNLRGRGELLQWKGTHERHTWTRIGGKRIERPKPRPHDITLNDKGNRRLHQQKPRPPANLERCKPSKKQVALAHWLKRDLWNRFAWDNCKVKRSDAHLFGYALRGIVAGYDLEAISRCFEKALKSRHGLATDIGLQTGSPTGVFFECSSTVSMALQELTLTPGRLIQKPQRPITARCGVRTSDNASHQAPVDLKRRPTTHCQRARFASIMDALK